MYFLTDLIQAIFITIRLLNLHILCIFNGIQLIYLGNWDLLQREKKRRMLWYKKFGVFY